jgi:imidazolonepropionase-like amidohydrolase
VEVIQNHLDQHLAAGVLAVRDGGDRGGFVLRHIHTSSVVDEMKILIQAGYTIEEVIRCASFNGAQLMGIKDLGLLSPGMPATFIVVEGDPSGLPESLRRPKAVYLKGELIG